MIREIVGDITRDGKGFIAHQVNYQGVMGAGVALSIKNKLLTDEQYKVYQEMCRQHGSELLGTTMFVSYTDDIMVANMFCQNDFSTPGSCITNYSAMCRCLTDLKGIAERWKMPVCFPGYIGCGIAGGDWSVVKQLITEIFGDSSVEATIIYWEGDQ